MSDINSLGCFVTYYIIISGKCLYFSLHIANNSVFLIQTLYVQISKLCLVIWFNLSKRKTFHTAAPKISSNTHMHIYIYNLSENKIFVFIAFPNKKIWKSISIFRNTPTGFSKSRNRSEDPHEISSGLERQLFLLLLILWMRVYGTSTIWTPFFPPRVAVKSILRVSVDFFYSTSALETWIINNKAELLA